MRNPVPIALCLALAACGEGAPVGEPAPGEGGAPAPVVAPATDAVDALAISADQAEARAFAWEGRFAAGHDLCRVGEWEIGSERVTTAGESECDVVHVARAPGQVTLELQCMAEGMPGEERWILSPRGEGMRVRRETAAETSDVDLVRC